jgi:SAM-dependent methyltransferase
VTDLRYDGPFWDRYFQDYDALDEVPPYQGLQDRVAELAAPKAGARVLDAGAGTGNLVVRLVRRGAKVVAIDANAWGLRRIGKKAPAAPCARATLEGSLPLRDAAFDAVATVNVLYTLSDAGREKCLAEIRRVLRPGGRAVIATPTVAGRPLRMYAEMLGAWRRREGALGAAVRMARFLPASLRLLGHHREIARRGTGGPYKFLSRAELESALSRAGFSVEGCEEGYARQVWIAWAKA